ncbi:MAG: helicase IV, partial [Mesorhizobium sp.]
MVIIASDQDGRTTVRGARYADALAFSETVKRAWVEYNLSALEKETFRFDRIHAGVASLERPGRYPSACRIAPLLQHGRALDATLLSKLQPEAIGPEQAERVKLVRNFVADPRRVRADSVSAFVEAELARWKTFFDTVES